MFLGLPDPDPLVKGIDSDPYHQAKIVRKTCFVTSLDFLSLKNDVNVPSKSDKPKNIIF
jgi:hypothetical protein